MRPAAQTQAVIEVLTDIWQSSSPADKVVEAFFRTRRFIGSGDRRNIGQAVWRILRNRAKLAFALN